MAQTSKLEIHFVSTFNNLLVNLNCFKEAALFEEFISCFLSLCKVRKTLIAADVTIIVYLIRL